MNTKTDLSECNEGISKSTSSCSPISSNEYSSTFENIDTESVVGFNTNLLLPVLGDEDELHSPSLSHYEQNMSDSFETSSTITDKEFLNETSSKSDSSEMFFHSDNTNLLEGLPLGNKPKNYSTETDTEYNRALTKGSSDIFDGKTFDCDVYCKNKNITATFHEFQDSNEGAHGFDKSATLPYHHDSTTFVSDDKKAHEAISTKTFGQIQKLEIDAFFRNLSKKDFNDENEFQRDPDTDGKGVELLNIWDKFETTTLNEESSKLFTDLNLNCTVPESTTFDDNSFYSYEDIHRFNLDVKLHEDSDDSETPVNSDDTDTPVNSDDYGESKQSTEIAANYDSNLRNSDPEGGSSDPESGSSDPESGSSEPEGPRNSGPESCSSDPEGGSSDPEGGSSNPESGSSNPESGSSNPESGSSDPEGGSSDSESGSSDPESLRNSDPESGSIDPESSQNSDPKSPQNSDSESDGNSEPFSNGNSDHVNSNDSRVDQGSDGGSEHPGRYDNNPGNPLNEILDGTDNYNLNLDTSGSHFDDYKRLSKVEICCNSMLAKSRLENKSTHKNVNEISRINEMSTVPKYGAKFKLLETVGSLNSKHLIHFPAENSKIEAEERSENIQTMAACKSKDIDYKHYNEREPIWKTLSQLSIASNCFPGYNFPEKMDTSFESVPYNFSDDLIEAFHTISKKQFDNKQFSGMHITEVLEKSETNTEISGMQEVTDVQSYFGSQPKPITDDLPLFLEHNSTQGEKLENWFELGKSPSEVLQFFKEKCNSLIFAFQNYLNCFTNDTKLKFSSDGGDTEINTSLTSVEEDYLSSSLGKSEELNNSKTQNFSSESLKDIVNLHTIFLHLRATAGTHLTADLVKENINGQMLLEIYNGFHELRTIEYNTLKDIEKVIRNHLVTFQSITLRSFNICSSIKIILPKQAQTREELEVLNKDLKSLGGEVEEHMNTIVDLFNNIDDCVSQYMNQSDLIYKDLKGFLKGDFSAIFN